MAIIPKYAFTTAIFEMNTMYLQISRFSLFDCNHEIYAHNAAMCMLIAYVCLYTIGLMNR